MGHLTLGMTGRHKVILGAIIVEQAGMKLKEQLGVMIDTPQS